MDMNAGLISSDPAPLQDLEECLGRWLQNQGSRLQETRLGLETAMQINPEKCGVLWRADILLNKTCQEFWNECAVQLEQEFQQACLVNQGNC